MKKLLYFGLFVIIGLAFSYIPINQIVGSDKYFSFFELSGPTVGAFLGGFAGALSVLIVKLLYTLFDGKSFDLVTFVRLFPMVFAALYFSTRSVRRDSFSKLISKSSTLSKRLKTLVSLSGVIIPVICIVLFVIHPEGRQAFLFSAFWLIPIIASFQKRSLILRSLGATFTAHAIGSVTFLYAFGLPAPVWNSLIPVVILERGLFTVGIAAFYMASNTAFAFMTQFVSLKGLSLDKKYLFWRP
ncbi:hypothetical protein KKH43_06420 [Patescibacteria group bacterium]|nr:hypothetical protein [Patescibacteria group bacterium]